MREVIEVAQRWGDPSRIVVGDVIGCMEAYLPEGRTIVITDSNVYGFYPDLVNRFEHIVISTGEENKTLATLEQLHKELLSVEADRQCFILGVGGGIVTDVAGFAASTYMRGVRFGFVATTLLAQVDASVGGKNGVNVGGYKNIAGTFNQPDFVLCDTSMLETLPVREFRAGLAEVIKAGIIADTELFGMIESTDFASLRANPELLTKIVAAAIKVKAAIVEADEREMGERRKLNLGHTIGHAVEKCSRDFLHGEAVSIGLAAVSDVAVEMGHLSICDRDRIEAVLRSFGLPLRSEIEPGRLFDTILSDKKRDGDSIHLVIPTSIGTCEVEKIPLDILKRLIM